MERSSQRPEFDPQLDFETFSRYVGEEAIRIWKDLQDTRAGASFIEQDYRDFSESVREVSRAKDVTIYGVQFARSENPSTRYLGQILLMSQALDPILKGVDELRKRYPEVEFDAEELIENRLAKVCKSLYKYGYSNNVIGIAKTTTLRDGEKIILGDKYEEIVAQRKANVTRRRVGVGPELVVPQPEEAVKPEEKEVVIPDLEKWRYWLDLARYGEVAAIIVLALIGANQSLNGRGISDPSTEISSERDSGVKVLWTEWGPIDPKRTLWLGDLQPLVPSQVKTRKVANFGLSGANIKTLREERVPVVKRGVDGQILSFSAFSDEPWGRVFLDGDRYAVAIERGKGRRDDLRIECRGEEKTNIFAVPASKGEIERQCRLIFPVIQHRDNGRIDGYRPVGPGINLR